MRACKWILSVAALVVAAGAASAHAAESAEKVSESGVVGAVKAGKPIIDIRYRFEWKEQDGFADNAYANTVRTRLGFETGELHGFKALIEFENVASIGRDRFNSTTNGLAIYPVIPDPNATELNRAQITFTGIDKTPITIGRQAYNLGNQRFVGAVDFRQNQQTFDAARVSSTFLKNVAFDYLYIDQVHRVFGDDHPLGNFESDSHIVAASFNLRDFGKFTGYGLLLDFDEAPAASSATWGVRYENTIVLDKAAGLKAGIIGEFASQSDYAANPFDYRERYIQGEGWLTASSATLRVGYERLGGNGAIGFSTPLATLHKFQGFADVFLTTPATGVEDLYGTAAYDWKNGPFGANYSVFATYHSFESELGDISYGDEIDAGLSVAAGKHWSGEIKGALYRGDGAFADRSLIWVSARFQY